MTNKREELDNNKEMKKLGDDYVVRHNSSYSPSKIISMNSGLAYSYPARSGQPTMKIYQHVDDRGVEYKNTYIANHYEMKYYNTDRYFKSGLALTNVAQQRYGEKSMHQLTEYYMEHYEELEDYRALVSQNRISYTPMKILDMCFWQIGFDHDAK